MGLVAAPLRHPKIALRTAPGVPVLQVLQCTGGVMAHVFQLTSGLARRGWDVEVATPGNSPIVDELAGSGVTVHELPMEREPGPSDITAARALRALDRRRGYGLVHSHSSKAGALVRAALPDRRRLLYTPHCFAFAAHFGLTRQLVYRAIEQAALSRTGALVAVCDWERRQAERLWGAESLIHQIDYGVRECNGAAPDPEVVMFKGDAPLAGMVSMLRPQKDTLLLVRAAARLHSLGQLPGRLAIIGNGPSEGAVREEIERLGVSDAVRWFPYRGSVNPYLAALDLFILPSAWEALPLSVLEAMSCGLPVVATAVGGTPEAVQDGVTGRVVPHGDEDALAGAIRELLSDPIALRRMGEAGRDAYETRFRVERMVDDMEALYRRQLRAAGLDDAAAANGNGRLRLT